MTEPLPGPPPSSNNVFGDVFNRLQNQVNELGRKVLRRITRNDGSTALDVAQLSTGETFLALYDPAGHIIVGEDALAGQGLARPWLALPGVPFVDTYIPAHSLGSWVVTWSTLTFYKQTPKVNVQPLICCRSGAAGDVRFKINGSVVGTTVSVGVNYFAVAPVQTLTLPGNFDDAMEITVECQVTNATGTIGAVFAATQRQS